MSLQQAIVRQQAADNVWSAAIDGHRRAEPDAGFADRLRMFSFAAGQQSESFRYAHGEGLQIKPWEPAASPRQPPTELRRGTARVGPVEMWREFDDAFAAWSSAMEQADLSVIADAYASLSDITDRLADAVDQQRGMGRYAATGG